MSMCICANVGKDSFSDIVIVFIKYKKHWSEVGNTGRVLLYKFLAELKYVFVIKLFFFIVLADELEYCD